MRKRKETKYIAIHCSATRPSQNIGAEWIRNLHVNFNGWSDIGYHFVICRDGVVEFGRDEWRVGAHEPKINAESVAICLVGGVAEEPGPDGRLLPENNYTDEQWRSLKTLVAQLLDAHKDAEVVGHNQFSTKACPCFDVPLWFVKTFGHKKGVRAGLSNEPTKAKIEKRPDVAWEAEPIQPPKKPWWKRVFG